jgi:hypothetical protein
MRTISSSRFPESHLIVAMIISWSGVAAAGMPTGAGTQAPQFRRANPAEDYGALPLAFEANHGQTNGDVRFLARGGGYTLFLTSTEAVLSMRSAEPVRPGHDGVLPPDANSFGDRRAPAVVRMRLRDANPTPVAIASDALPGRANYFLGREATGWKTGIPTYGAVTYREVYPGVDLIFYGNQGRLEHDFVVRPGVDPDVIRMQFTGADEMRIDANGDLVLSTGDGQVRLESPRLYQDVAQDRQIVDGSYVLHDAGTVGFKVGSYDRTRPLIIDPILVYSSFLGGTAGDDAWDVAVDALGQAYVTGTTLSADFPPAGGGDPSYNGGYDAFVVKLDPTGTTAIYSSYLGGSNDESGAGGIAVDALGNAYVAAGTRSTDFPITAGAPDASCVGCGTFPLPSDAFVTKLDPTGAIVYSTYLGGDEYDTAYGIAVDAAGQAYVSGGIAFGYNTCSFPIVNGYDNCANSYYDAFVTKVDAAGTAFLYSTTLGGTNDEYCGCDIAVDETGNAIMTGVSRSIDFPTTGGAYDGVCGTSFVQHDGIFDAIAVKINTNAIGAASLVYSTCIGGGLDDSGSGVTIDGTGRIWLTGSTYSTDFPTVNPADGSVNGAGDAFVAELDPLAIGSAQLLYGTYLGGGGNDGANAVVLDGDGNVWVAGATASTDFPTQDFIQVHQGNYDVFVSKLNPTLSGSAQILFSTYLGGCESDNGVAMVLDPLGNAYVAGLTASMAFPTTVGALQPMYGGGAGDGFIAKISGSGPSVEVAGCLPPTATLLSMFEARRTDEGLELRWELGDVRDIAEVELQRSEWAIGPWRTVSAERRNDGGVTVVLDRGVEPDRTYYYRLIVRTFDGQVHTFGPLVGAERPLVTEFALSRVAPNPTRRSAQIEFAVPREARIRVSILDVQGREVALLADGIQPAGRYRAVWDGQTLRGPAASGLYFVRYQNPSKHSMQRLILLP